MNDFKIFKCFGVKNKIDLKNVIICKFIFQVAIPQYQLELWPGYVSSIRQFEYDILMSAEITHKVMRQQTLLDILNETYHYQKQDFKV